jgi:hypothetical protein
MDKKIAATGLNASSALRAFQSIQTQNSALAMAFMQKRASLEAIQASLSSEGARSLGQEDSSLVSGIEKRVWLISGLMGCL